MNKFTYIKFIGLGTLLTPVALVVIPTLIYLFNTIDVLPEQSQIPRVETRVDTVIVHKTVTDTVRIKVFEKVPAPKTETPLDSI